MLSGEKLSWIRSNLCKRNDKKAIYEELQESYPELTHTQVYAILLGRYYGIYGDIVVAAAEKFINKRLKQLQKDAKKYSTETQL